jgi:hypothetical protein
MGRGVSSPNYALHKVYFPFEFENEDGFEWDFMIDEIRETFKSLFKSLYNSDTWLDREDKVLLENDHCQIGISEYCGLCCLWVVIKEENDFNPNLSYSWVDKNIIPIMNKYYSDLKKMGTMSNGVSVYEKVLL